MYAYLLRLSFSCWSVFRINYSYNSHDHRRWYFVNYTVSMGNRPDEKCEKSGCSPLEKTAATERCYQAGLNWSPALLEFHTILAQFHTILPGQHFRIALVL